MKTHRLGRILCGLALALLLSASLTSCDSDDYWWGGPPSGWNSVNDPRIAGYWQLYQSNGQYVRPGDANYLYFDGYNGGYYYWLRNGFRNTEEIRYYCQPSVSGTSRYEINIQYQDGGIATESYWFPNGPNQLWLQWYDSDYNEVVTYVYRRIGGAPW